MVRETFLTVNGRSVEFFDQLSLVPFMYPTFIELSAGETEDPRVWALELIPGNGTVPDLPREPQCKTATVADAP